MDRGLRAQSSLKLGGRTQRKLHNLYNLAILHVGQQCLLINRTLAKLNKNRRLHVREIRTKIK